MKRIVIFTSGLISYALFLAAFLYALAFTLGVRLPQPLPAPDTVALPAVLIDAGFLLAFGVQHSVMARARWKAFWTTIVPPALERSVYVCVTSVILLATFWFWQPLPGVVWQINVSIVRAIVYGICLLGWGIVLLSTFQIDHFELFGLRQVWQALRGQPNPPAEFRLPFLYRIVRHPMMVGFLIVFWATPTMTPDHLLFALGMTIYIWIGITFEERALRRQFDSVYQHYQAEVPQVLPLPRKRPGVVGMSPRFGDSETVARDG